MILFPPAKINLGLHILFKRQDGYHELETGMVVIPFFDILEIIPSDTFHFKQTGLPIPGDISSNLCIKAYELMRQEYNIPAVYIHLRKIIPMGGGLGGGSSNAAYVLKGINSLFSLNLVDARLQELASRLGSDCPFFIKDNPQVATGRGEIVQGISLNLSGHYLKIINAGIHVSTIEAYDGVHFSANSIPLRDILMLPMSNWKNKLVNDFEKTVFAKYPQLAAIKTKLYSEGAVYAAMSGSGSTLFGLFTRKPKMTFSAMRGGQEMILQLE
jgi:4-diphosphocytidyl-2-C-methyl-D-erythritol kinase